MEQIGISRRYFMEQLILKAEASKTLRFYDLDHFWEQELFKKNQDTNEIEKDGKFNKVLEALDFLSKFIKKDATLKSSDFCVCFLESFNMIFPKYFEER